MQGPFFQYLTNSYVEALGLEPFLYRHKDPVLLDVPIGPGLKLFNVPFTGFDWAVVYNHGLYLRSLDGLSWDRKR